MQTNSNSPEMKIILSRKGFDSESGCNPSPILPDKRMISLPIPSQKSHMGKTSYSELKFEKNRSYYDLMKDLGILKKDERCHLDPDIRKDLLIRDREWRPLFGQVGVAQSHLEKQGVKEGDIFLFFGTFRKTDYLNDRLRFDPKESSKHVIFGYLQIGKRIRLDLNYKDYIPKWIEYHPHAMTEMRKKSKNTLYLARDKVSWNNAIPGAGFFVFDKRLVLTKEGHPKSHWDLPKFFRTARISYHNSSSWTDSHLLSRSRGQEFVIEDEKVERWARDLIEKVERER